MKNVSSVKYLPLMAFLLAGGLALGTGLSINTPNVYNANDDELGAPDWQSITQPQHATCGEASSRPCLGFRESEEDEVETITTGNKPN